MRLDGHLGKLRQKHADIEREIAKETLRPVPDTIRITALKRQKLKLKEEITRFNDIH
ncbi:MAG: DUF465 domain-containing protein [Alphaproteobacteria bacterium]|nr:MAG: DUF465 domain-containing protein [Alphaproteobacteria bacterium]